MTVIMPVPRRSEDNVSSAHADFLAFHGGEAAFAFDDEAECKSDMTMGTGCFARSDKL